MKPLSLAAAFVDIAENFSPVTSAASPYTDAFKDYDSYIKSLQGKTDFFPECTKADEKLLDQHIRYMKRDEHTSFVPNRIDEQEALKGPLKGRICVHAVNTIIENVDERYFSESLMKTYAEGLLSNDIKARVGDKAKEGKLFSWFVQTLDWNTLAKLVSYAPEMSKWVIEWDKKAENQQKISVDGLSDGPKLAILNALKDAKQAKALKYIRLTFDDYFLKDATEFVSLTAGQRYDKLIAESEWKDQKIALRKDSTTVELPIAALLEVFPKERSIVFRSEALQKAPINGQVRKFAAVVKANLTKEADPAIRAMVDAEIKRVEAYLDSKKKTKAAQSGPLPFSKAEAENKDPEPPKSEVPAKQKCVSEEKRDAGLDKQSPKDRRRWVLGLVVAGAVLILAGVYFVITRLVGFDEDVYDEEEEYTQEALKNAEPALKAGEAQV